MEWGDEAVVLSARRHGEASVLAVLLTRCHGRHTGLVRGGAGKALRGVLQPGNRVAAVWRARLAEQLGQYHPIDPLRAYGAEMLDDPERLAALASLCAVAEAALPDREPHEAVYEGMIAVLDAFGGEGWPSLYVHWEKGLLQELGYGLDLSCCAATGSRDDLAYVSPKSGRAVSRAAGEPYRDKLLPLPAFLVEGGIGDRAAVLAGLRLTGYFLERHVLSPHRAVLPAARSRFVDRFRR